jgi:hypothetical protein
MARAGMTESGSLDVLRLNPSALSQWIKHKLIMLIEHNSTAVALSASLGWNALILNWRALYLCSGQVSSEIDAHDCGEL